MTVPHNGWLITGGTGFLGRALVRRLLKDDDEMDHLIDGVLGPAPRYSVPARICIYSRGEATQAAMRAEFKDDERLRFFIGDVRDRWRLRRAMESVEVVVHAAALKRVEVGEYNPTEMVQTNVLGSMNVIEAAIDAGVEAVLAVSTDKAVEPLNCYGATKLVAEKLFLGAAQMAPHGPKFVVVRYGNVAGSTGSVIPIWRAELAAGRTPIIRSAEATRFWITADQAVDIVLEALERPSGSLVVPDLPAYQLADLYAAMVGFPHMRVDGPLNPGEKNHESLLGAEEPGGLRRSDQARRMTVEELRAELIKI